MITKKNGQWRLYDKNGGKKVTEGSLSHVMREDQKRKSAPKKTSGGSY